MEKLFALRNIHLQPMADDDGFDLMIAYNDRLLDLNILIEFAGVAISEDSNVPEEISIHAISLQNDILYSYVLFVSGELLGPLPVYRLIADAVEFIERCNADTVLNDLEQICTSASRYDANYENREYYESIVWKFKTVLELIGENKK